MSLWGIGVVRTPKPPTPPKESKYHNQRQTELEALRQRGLAKLLNKHFTSVTALIAAERAEADAAIRDLEEKRKLHKDFVSNPSELSHWDALYLEQQKKRADCKRKEKETLMLYQRYVDKFGKTGAISVPTTDEVGKVMKNPLSNGLTSTNVTVGKMAKEIEATLSSLVSSGADRHPSIQYLGVGETIQQLQAKAELEESLFSKTTLAARGVDAKARPSPIASKEARAESGVDILMPMQSDLPSPMTAATDDAEDEDDDDRSAVSGLTSTHSLVASDAELQLLNFLKTETEAIRKMIDQEESASVKSAKTSRSYDASSESARAAQKAEDMVRQMNTMLQDFQQDKTETAKVLADYPYKLETANAKENWMVYYDELQEREYYHNTDTNTVQWKKPGVNSEESVRSAKPTDSDYMPMSDYTKKDTRSRSASLPEPRSLTLEPRGLTREGGMSRRDLYRRKQRKRRKQRRIMAALLTLLFMLLAAAGTYRYENDTLFAQRVDHFLAHETFQQAKSQMNHLLSLVPEPIADPARSVYHRAVPYLPDFMTGEKKRLALAAVQMDQMRVAAEMQATADAERKIELEVTRKVAELMTREADTKTDAETKVKAAKEKKAKEVAAKQAKQVNDRKAKEAAKQARENAAQLRKLEAQAARAAAEEEAEQRRRQQEEMDQLRRLEEEAARLAAEEQRRRELRRPWACNIPFAYIIHPRCRRLSSANPVFNLKELVDAMMQ